MSCEPWQCAEIAATKKANPIQKPEIAVAIIKKAANPLLIVGSNSTERFMEGKPAIEFLKRDYEPAGFMTAMDIGNRLVDPAWQGIDGKGHPDLALFIGLPYYMESLILSGLKHFATGLKTMTLDNMYHAHASWSFPNASVDEWVSNLRQMTSKFRSEQGQH
jgi:acetyl-CoA decarbonylase/synthase complex subunit epsilon